MVSITAMPNEVQQLRDEWGERLRALRTDRGLSLRDLAALTGLSSPYLSKLENGQTGVSDGVRMRLAQALSTPEDAVTVEGLFPYPPAPEKAAS